MIFYATALWLYAVMASLVLGASLYESLVVHPAWSRKPPESFVGFVGAPISRMNIAAFWVPVAPLYAISSLGALAVALWAGRLTLPLTVSAACAVSGVAWTLVYFRPTIGRFLETGGGTLPPTASSPRHGGGFCSIGSELRWSRSPGGVFSGQWEHMGERVLRCTTHGCT
jgi:hypothetical protein